MKSFEDAILRSVDAEKRHLRREEEAEKSRTHIEEAWDKAKETLKNRIDPHDFMDLYGSQGIREDLQAVVEHEKIFSAGYTHTEQGKSSLIFEAIMDEGIALHDWFGPDADTIRPSRFDDVFNGIDSITEFQKEEGASHLALAIDVTFDPNIKNKIEKIARGVEHGELTHVKYFKSDHMNFRGELRNVPKVIVGADKRTIKELADLWVTDRKALAKHPIQFKVLEEIQFQLSAFEHYAERNRQSGVAGIYRKARIIVEKIMEEKGIIISEKEFRDDTVFSALKKYVEDLGK